MPQDARDRWWQTAEIPRLIADCRAAFKGIGVITARLEAKRGRKIDEFIGEDVAALRVIYGSIKRGEIPAIADEFFEPEPEKSMRSAEGKLDTLEKAIEVKSDLATTPTFTHALLAQFP